MKNRMFLVENGNIVVIRNGDTEVSFATLDEFYKYCPIAEFGIDLAGKNYIDYEPDRGIYIDDREAVSMANVPVFVFENIIDNIEIIAARKGDPFYAKSEEECREIQLGRINEELKKYIYSRYDQGTQSSLISMYLKNESNQVIRDQIDAVWNWIKIVLEYYYSKKDEIIASAKPDDVSWNFAEFNPLDPGISLSLLMGNQAKQ